MSQEKIADKVSKLLRKAEATNSMQEAETFVAKAQVLMTQYQITEAMLKPEEERRLEPIIEERIEYKGRYYHLPRRDLGQAVADANDCKTLQTRVDQSTTILWVIGHESDVARVRQLDASLQVQATAAMHSWWKEVRDQHQWLSEYNKSTLRRDFIAGFARQIRNRLQQAKQQGQQQAVDVTAQQSGDSTEQVSEGVALVLRDKQERVDSWIDQKYGKLGRSRGNRYRYSGGYNAGKKAAASADIGNARIKGRRALSS